MVFDVSWYVRQEEKIQEADVRAAMARRKRHAMLDDGYVYAVEFSSGVVKVGKTTDPGSRLANHAKYAEIHGGAIRESWTSELHNGYTKTERQLIEFCQQRGAKVFGKEYFGGLDFNIVRDFAEITVQLSQIDNTVNTMRRGCGGDLDMNALEAWKRGQAEG